MNKQHRHANRGDGDAEGGGKDGGSKEIQKRFRNQYAGIAGHPFLHRTEYPRAAGAEQNNDRNVVLNKRLVRAVLRLARSGNQIFGFAYRVIDALFQIAKFADQRAEQRRQYHHRQVGAFHH